MTYPMKGMADYLDLGNWNARCSMCSNKRKASTLVKNWQGMWRCPEHNEIRQPQDFVKGVPDIQTPPWVQPIKGDNFAAVCDPNSRCAVPGYAGPGCFYPSYIAPGNTIPYYNPGQVT